MQPNTRNETNILDDNSTLVNPSIALTVEELERSRHSYASSNTEASRNTDVLKAFPPANGRFSVNTHATANTSATAETNTSKISGNSDPEQKTQRKFDKQKEKIYGKRGMYQLQVGDHPMNAKDQVEARENQKIQRYDVDQLENQEKTLLKKIKIAKGRVSKLRVASCFLALFSLIALIIALVQD